jgi:hypothetical protein
MNFRLVLVLVAVACLLLTRNALTQQKAQQNNPAHSRNPESAAAEARSRKVWEDFKNRNKAALSATLAENFRALEEGGSGFFGAKQYLSSLDEFELKSYNLSDYVVIPLGKDALLINYHARYEGAEAGETTKGNAGFSEVWVRRVGNWKLQYLEETYVK